MIYPVPRPVKNKTIGIRIQTSSESLSPEKKCLKLKEMNEIVDHLQNAKVYVISIIHKDSCIFTSLDDDESDLTDVFGY